MSESKEIDVKVLELKVADLVPSSWNRTDLGNGDLKDLAASIKMEGVIQPLLVRGMGNPGNKPRQFEIVAGHRRAEAAKMAGLKEVPCIVGEFTDEEAKRFNLVENLHRKNLNPMEEARAFQSLREGNAHTPQTIADMIGKNVKYVYRSLELLRLPPNAIRALEKGIITAAHGHQLVRVGPKQLESIVKYAITPGYKDQVPDVEALKSYISGRVEKDLSNVPWDKNVEFAGKPACKGCPYNTKNQASLFDGAEDGHCTNGACFTGKLHQFYKDLQEKGAKRWSVPFLGTVSSSYGEDKVIKGYKVVEDKDPKIKDKINSVEFGFAIIKPSQWGKVKAPKLVLCKKLPKAQAEAQAKGQRGYQTDPLESLEVQFLSNFVKRETAIELFNKGEVGKKACLWIVQAHFENDWGVREDAHWLNAAGIDPNVPKKDLMSAIAKLPDETLGKLLYWVKESGTQEIIAEASKIDLHAFQKRSMEMARKHWKENKETLIAEYNAKVAKEGNQ